MFQDRAEAGQQVARCLQAYATHPNAVVLGIARGGVPVAYEIAAALNLPLDVYVVRKLGLPGFPEMAMGAIASGGASGPASGPASGNVRYLNSEIIQKARVSDAEVNQVTEREQRELRRREQEYRGGRSPLVIQGRTVILVDDGLATGATMRVAIRALRQQSPAQIVVAVPVAAPEICGALESEADDVICVKTPQPFCSVSRWYETFPQTTDQEVRELLCQSQYAL